MTKSPALQLFELAMEHAGRGMGRSNIRCTQARGYLIRGAIMFGIPFGVNDFVALAENPHGYRGSPWYEADEQDYALACGRERGRVNQSAARAYEKWRGREPFLLRDPPNKTSTRMYVGRQFLWYGEPVTCTSFDDEKASIVACSYHEIRRSRAKINRRHTLTHGDIREFHKACDEWPARRERWLQKAGVTEINRLINSLCGYVDRRWIAPPEIAAKIDAELEFRDAKVAIVTAAAPGDNT